MQNQPMSTLTDSGSTDETIVTMSRNYIPNIPTMELTAASNTGTCSTLRKYFGEPKYPVPNDNDCYQRKMIG